MGEIRVIIATHRRDVFAVGALVCLVTAFLLPLVLQWWPSVFDDCPILELPGLVATARLVQSGSLPLWDTGTFAGAKPTYVDNAYLIFYLPMYPFFLYANTEDLRHSHTVLMLAPLLIHLVSAAVGSYVFGRVVLRLHPTAAVLMGLMYSLSPDMGFQLVSTAIAMTLSYVPWCALAVARFVESGRWCWWCAGAVLLAVMGSAGNPNYLIRVYFALSVMTVLLWILVVVQTRPDSNRRSDGPVKQRWYVARILAAVAMFAVSIGLAGVTWAGTFESISWLDDAIDTMYSQYSNMYPMNIVTMFIPGFFGDLDARHTWGVGRLLSNHSTLSGGMFAMVAAVGAILISIRKGENHEQAETFRRWTWISACLLLGSLVTMMGQHTFVFRTLCAVAPWFFRIPHPVYYRFAFCWSLSILVGIGVSRLLQRSTQDEHHAIWTRATVVCIGAGLMGAGLGLYWGYDGTWSGASGYTTLSSQGQWAWFLTVPVVYFSVASCVLIAGFTFQFFRPYRHWFCLGVLLDVGYIAWSLFYATSHLGIQHPDEGRIDRHASVDQYPGVQRLLPLTRQLVADRRFRCIGSDSRFDNIVWYVNGRALLGYSAKPLMPWYAEMIGRFTKGKQALQLTDYPEQLFRNMNVRYQIILDRVDDPLLEAVSKPGQASSPALQHPALSTMATETGPVVKPFRGTTPTESQQPVGKLVHQAGPFLVYEIDNPLPYIYTQDRVFFLETDAQLDQLFTSDLRQTVFVDPQRRPGIPIATGTAAFNELQHVNQIKLLNTARSNQKSIRAEISRPAMLVINECWHPDWKASVNGKPVRVDRVNFLQQGIWLDKGSHKIELFFSPTSIRYGFMISTFSASIIVLVIIVSAIRWRRSPRRHTAPAGGKI